MKSQGNSQAPILLLKRAAAETVGWAYVQRDTVESQVKVCAKGSWRVALGTRNAGWLFRGGAVARLNGKRRLSVGS
ncbi:hypothetical protein L1887_54139 [Cichorium endivia]|nr:hypothetical protein L1887_54139 [Cichorium endivia]